MNRIYISSQCHNKTQENRNEPVRRVSDIQTLCSISRHWGQHAHLSSWSHFTAQFWRSLLRWPKALEPTLVDMKFLLISLPDLLSEPAILWVTQVALLQDLFWAVMLICRMEKKRKSVSEKLRASATPQQNYFSERHQWTLNISSKHKITAENHRA